MARAKKEKAPVKKQDNKKVKIIQPSSGRFRISASVGDVIELEQKQMEEMVDLGYAEWV